MSKSNYLSVILSFSFHDTDTQSHHSSTLKVWTSPYKPGKICEFVLEFNQPIFWQYIELARWGYRVACSNNYRKVDQSQKGSLPVFYYVALPIEKNTGAVGWDRRMLTKTYIGKPAPCSVHYLTLPTSPQWKNRVCIHTIHQVICLAPMAAGYLPPTCPSCSSACHACPPPPSTLYQVRV